MTTSTRPVPSVGCLHSTASVFCRVSNGSVVGTCETCGAAVTKRNESDVTWRLATRALPLLVPDTGVRYPSDVFTGDGHRTLTKTEYERLFETTYGRREQ